MESLVKNHVWDGCWLLSLTWVCISTAENDIIVRNIGLVYILFHFWHFMFVGFHIFARYTQSIHMYLIAIVIYTVNIHCRIVPWFCYFQCLSSFRIKPLEMMRLPLVYLLEFFAMSVFIVQCQWNVTGINSSVSTASVFAAFSIVMATMIVAIFQMSQSHVVCTFFLLPTKSQQKVSIVQHLGWLVHSPFPFQHTLHICLLYTNMT